ncbi:Maf family protein [Pseudokineococcus sp. 1T1Z-3]|uniref:Maf family protein n=1 Tax=Pseudokineococcus sp. 1T1Z-3 TaxID=3132745 RepID=UPI0030B11C43
MRLVLASASPARLQLLRSAGVDPLVLVSAVDEPAVVDRYGVQDAEDVCLVLARAKAEDVAARLEDVEELGGAGALVVGCDSVLELDGEVHGRPADAAEAAARWRRMRGRAGVLHSGHWLVDARPPEDGGSGATLGAVSSTTVHFADVDDAEVDAYVATGEPLRVAGAFTLDGLGAPYVAGVEGEPSAVVGLGLATLRGLLADAGVRWSDVRAPHPAATRTS